MKRAPDPDNERAADLRRAFDQAFCEAPAGPAQETESLLALRVGGGAYAVRLDEIAGLFADQAIVRLPTAVTEFLGVSGLRHDVVPVYDLRSLLGYTVGGDRPRWLVTARSPHPVAFAFEHFEGHLRVLRSASLPSRDGAGSAHVRATLSLADGPRGVVSIAALLETIEDRIRRLGKAKEH